MGNDLENILKISKKNAEVHQKVSILKFKLYDPWLSEDETFRFFKYWE